MPRVTPVASKAEVAPEHQAVVDDVLKVFGAVRGPFSMMLHSPEMTKRMLPLVPFFRDESVVEGKLRSVGILAAVREREAAYVWAAQVAAARRNGLRDEAIDLLRAKAEESKFPAEEAAIVTYVRQLMRTNRAEQVAFVFQAGFGLFDQGDVLGNAECADHISFGIAPRHTARSRSVHPSGRSAMKAMNSGSTRLLPSTRVGPRRHG